MSMPKYEQFAEMVREKIRSGEWLPKQKLPSTSAFKADGWRQGTITSGMRMLRAEGWVRGQPGEAVFVADEPPLSSRES